MFDYIQCVNFYFFANELTTSWQLFGIFSHFYLQFLVIIRQVFLSQLAQTEDNSQVQFTQKSKLIFNDQILRFLAVYQAPQLAVKRWFGLHLRFFRFVSNI